MSCGALVGRGVWLGCDDGHLRAIWAYSRFGDIVRNWQAHLFPVLSIAAVGSTVRAAYGRRMMTQCPYDHRYSCTDFCTAHVIIRCTLSERMGQSRDGHQL